MVDFKAGFFKTKRLLRAATRSVLRDTVALMQFLLGLRNGVHKQNGRRQWAACSEVQAIMRQMSGYWEPTAGGGGTSLLLLVGFTLSLSLFSLLCLSWPFALSSSLANMRTCTCENTRTCPLPPHISLLPLVLIIPLQIRGSISSCIIVPPHPPTSASPYLLSASPFMSGERSCPLSPCQPRWPGSPGSHIPSWPIGALRRGRAQLDDIVLPEEKRRGGGEKKPIAVINLFRFPPGTVSPGTHPIFMYPHTRHLLLLHPPSSFFYCVCEE